MEGIHAFDVSTICQIFIQISKKIFDQCVQRERERERERETYNIPFKTVYSFQNFKIYDKQTSFVNGFGKS